MQPYDDLVTLALICARRAREAPNNDAAAELWRIAMNYRSRAADYGDPPEVGVSSLNEYPERRLIMATGIGEKTEALVTFNAVGLIFSIICLVIFALLLFDEAIELIAPIKAVSHL